MNGFKTSAQSTQLARRRVTATLGPLVLNVLGSVRPRPRPLLACSDVLKKDALATSNLRLKTMNRLGAEIRAKTLPLILLSFPARKLTPENEKKKGNLSCEPLGYYLKN